MVEQFFSLFIKISDVSSASEIIMGEKQAFMKKFKKNLYKIFREELFSPIKTCNVCGREIFDGEFLCEDCMRKVDFLGDEICEKCGRPNKQKPCVCASCKKHSFVDRSRSLFSYEGVGETLVKKLKYDDGRYLSALLAEMLKNVYLKNYFTPDVITFVPMTEEALYERGYNQSRLLAEDLSELVGVECTEILVKNKDTAHQAGLDFSERQKNLKGVYSLKKGIKVKDKKILLVDDVLTTGATADEIAKLLKERGAKSVYLLTLASVALSKDK